MWQSISGHFQWNRGVGRAGHLLIETLVVQSLAAPVCMPNFLGQFPWCKLLLKTLNNRKTCLCKWVWVVEWGTLYKVKGQSIYITIYRCYISITKQLLNQMQCQMFLMWADEKKNQTAAQCSLFFQMKVNVEYVFVGVWSPVWSFNSPWSFDVPCHPDQ